MKKVKVAVLGYGHLGKWHCQKVEAHSNVAEFVAIVEKFGPNKEAAKTNHPQVKVVDDISEIINEIDAAIIVTPTSTHHDLVKYLINNKKHVFCEKPVCSNDKEAASLKSLATAGLVVQVGHSERFHEAWDLLKESFHNLKSPYSIRINRVAPFKGRATDVDVIQDLGIHDLDLILHLFQDKPTAVTAQGYKIRTNNYDHAAIQVELTNGSRADIVLGRNAVKEVRELEVISQSGMITVDLFTNKILNATNTQFEDQSFVKENNYSKRDHLLLEHKHFYDSILNSEKSVVTLEDGLKAVHLVDAALKSIESHKKELVNFG